MRVLLTVAALVVQSSAPPSGESATQRPTAAPSSPPSEAPSAVRSPRSTSPVVVDVEEDAIDVDTPTESGSSSTEYRGSKWVLVVGEGARLCAAFEEEARSAHTKPSGSGNVDDKSWRRRARDCPHSVWVLRAAVSAELRTRFGFPDASPTAAQVEELEAQLRRSRRRALRWLDVMEREQAVWGRGLLPRDVYYVAWAQAGAGHFERARLALARTVQEGGATSAEVQRLSALISLFEGDLVRASVESRRALFGGGEHDELISLYVRAVILDRAGDTEEAARLFVDARRRDRSGRDALLMLETQLPVHERLYVRALDRQFEGTTTAALRYWRAYLDHPKPTAAEKLLARRHLASLVPVPEPIIDDRTTDSPPAAATPATEPPDEAAPPSRVD